MCDDIAVSSTMKVCRFALQLCQFVATICGSAAIVSSVDLRQLSRSSNAENCSRRPSTKTHSDPRICTFEIMRHAGSY